MRGRGERWEGERGRGGGGGRRGGGAGGEGGEYVVQGQGLGAPRRRRAVRPPQAPNNLGPSSPSPGGSGGPCLSGRDRQASCRERVGTLQAGEGRGGSVVLFVGGAGLPVRLA
jgi:hypothetical protein